MPTGLELFGNEHSRIVLVDLDSSTQTLEMLKAILAPSGAEVIVAGRDTSAEFAMTAIRDGACAVEVGERNPEKLVAVIKRLLDLAQERQRVTDLDRQLLQASQFQGMISRSPIMWESKLVPLNLTSACQAGLCLVAVMVGKVGGLTRASRGACSRVEVRF